MRGLQEHGETADVQAHVVDLRKGMLEAQSNISELRREMAKSREGQMADLAEELEKTRTIAAELRKDLSLTFQLEVANLHKDLS
eukprot:g7578.t1